MRRHLPLVLALALLLGCKGTPVTTAHPSAAPSTKAKPPVGAAVEATRIVGTGAELISKARLTGNVRLLVDPATGLIGPNGGGIISNNSGGVVSDNGLGVVSDNGLGLVSKARYGLLAVQETALADARIEVLDGNGKLLVDAQGKPIGVSTDKNGAYTLEADLPNENLVLRVRLFPNGGKLAGTLSSIVVNGPDRAQRQVAIDTASSLGSAFVLDRFVKGRADVLAKLPAAEAQALYGNLAAAALVPPATYQPAALADAVDGLRAKTPALDQTLERIKALLLVGQANLGDGRPATRTALGVPSALLVDGDRLLVAEGVGRVRAISLRVPDQPMNLVIGAGDALDNGDGGPARAARLQTAVALAKLPDGSLVIADDLARQLRRVAPDGTISTLPGELPGNPRALVAQPDGSLLIALWASGKGVSGKLVLRSPDGKLTEQGLDPALGNQPITLAQDAAGVLYALDQNTNNLIMRKDGTWRTLASGFEGRQHGGMVLAPQGGVYVADPAGHRVWHVSRTGEKTPVAGTGQVGTAGDGGPATAATFADPTGLALDADGTLYVSDAGNGLVRAVGPDGTVRTVAGSRSALQVGEALAVPINGPNGLALDPQGRLVIAETLGATVKRLDGDQVTIIAGSTTGNSGDGGPATQARFALPGALAYRGGELIIADATNRVLRRVDAAGTISTLVTPLGVPEAGRRTYPAKGTPMVLVTAMAVAKDGTLYWVENGFHQVWKMGPDGQSELIAGATDGKGGHAGDGGPAADATFDSPFGLALAPDEGALYVSDAAAFNVRRIDLKDPQRKITRFAGLTLEESTSLLLGGGYQPSPTEGALICPLAIAFGPDGNLYVSEAGTSRVDALNGVPGGTKTFQGGAGVLALLPKVPPRIRVVHPDGTMDTVAGPGGKVLTNPAGEGAFGGTTAMIFDKAGQLVISDLLNNQVKLVPKAAFSK